MKKIKLIILLSVAAAAIVVYMISGPKSTDPIGLDTNGDRKDEYSISFIAPEIITVEESGQTVKSEKLQSEKIYNYTVRDKGRVLGTITLTLRQIQDRDFIYFINYKNTHPTGQIAAVIRVLDAEPTVTGRQITYDATVSNTTSRWTEFPVSLGSRLTPANKLPKNSVFLDSAAHYIRLGLVDIFRPLKNGVREELYAKSQPVTVSKSGRHINYRIPLPQEAGCFTETWGILGSSPLIDWRNQTAVADAKTGDLNRYRKLSTNGIYYLTPNNYDPTSPTAFWLNPGYHVAELYSKQSAGGYFNDIAVTSIYTALTTQNAGGYWPSTPRSDWLYKDYGIPAGFYDTRFSTDSALFLLHMYQKYDDQKALTGAEKYAVWLKRHIDTQGIKTAHGGVLVPDYAKPGTPHKKTHVSLNHLVTEINFLYQLYLVNGDEDNLRQGNRIRQAVNDTGSSWIRADGDLHYAYLTNGKYGLQDYPLVTLKDLRLSQELIEKLTGSTDPVFQMLIDAKEAYLKKHNMPLK